MHSSNSSDFSTVKVLRYTVYNELMITSRSDLIERSLYMMLQLLAKYMYRDLHFAKVFYQSSTILIYQTFTIQTVYRTVCSMIVYAQLCCA